MRKHHNNHFGYSAIFKHARFMAEPADGDGSMPEIEVSPAGSTDDGTKDDDIELLRAQLAKANAERERYKNSIDNLTRKNKELTDKNRQHMSAEQLEKEAQEERDKRFAEMEQELRTSRYSKRLVGIGMAEADADAFAATIPEMEDSDQFFTTLSDFVKAREKSASENAIQELLKNRPDINAGNGDADKDSPALALAKATVAHRHNNGASQSIIDAYHKH